VLCGVKRPAVFTITASAAFAETLAKGLIARIGDDPLTLSSAVIYLPTRRAARNFGDAFARVLGGAALLPQFKPLGDSEEDELLLVDDALELAPAIKPLRRQMLLARLIVLAREVGHHTIVALIDAEQAPSVALHRAAGFELVAHLKEVGFKFGRWLDVIYMQKML